MKINNYLPRDFCVDTVVHVGAHLGQELDFYLSIGSKRVIFIEADPYLFNLLQDRVTKMGLTDRVIVLNSLISSTDGKKVYLNIYNNYRGSSSIYLPDEKMELLYPNVKPTGENVSLRTSRLDTLLEANDVDPSSLDLLIYDIQGSEYLALLGTGKYLGYPYFLEIEVSVEPIYKGSACFNDIDLLLASCEFKRIDHSIPPHGDIVYYNKSRFFKNV